MKKVITVMAILPLIISVFFIFTSADVCHIYDADGVLYGEGVASAEQALATAEGECGIPVRVYLRETYSSYIDEDMMISQLGLDDEENIVILLIDSFFDSYEFELFTYGKTYDWLSDTDVEYIYDCIQPEIKSGQLAEGIVEFSGILSERLIAGRTASRIGTVIFSIVVALLSAGGAVGGVVYCYKRKLKSPIYPVNKYATLYLDYSTDNFINSTVTRTRINTSSGGGGGGGRSGGSRGRR